MYLENFPKKIKQLRLSNNLTQSELADILETTKQAISSYESGKAKPSLHSLIKLSEHFNISLDSLVFDKNDTDFSINLVDNVSLKVELISIQNKITKILSDLDSSDINQSKKNNSTSEISNLDSIGSSKLHVADSYSNTYHEEYADEIAPDISLSETNYTQGKVVNVDFSKPPTNSRDVPNFDRVAAGSPGYTCEDIICYISIPEKKLQPHLEYFVVSVKGDSMNRLYHNDEQLLVEKSPLINNGDLVIASIITNLGDTTFKKISFKDGETILTPMSTNPIHKVQIYKNEDVHVLGKVLGKLEDFLD